jgi:hypothetical protein
MPVPLLLRVGEIIKANPYEVKQNGFSILFI